MSGLEALSGAVLAGLWKTSWQVALLVVFVLSVQLLFRRWLSPRWRYGLWLLVVARLFVPVVPQVPLGLVPWEATAVEPTPTAVPFTPAGPEPGATRAEPRRDANPQETGPDGVESGDPAPWPRSLGQRNAPVAAASSVEPPAKPTVRPTATQAQRTGPATGTVHITRGSGAAEPTGGRPLPWRLPLAALWLAGVGLLAARTLGAERRFRRRLADAVPVTDRRVLDLLAECAREVGVRRPLRVLTTDLVVSPAVCGVRRPLLLLPRHVPREFSSAELRCVFLHELHHLRAPDVLLNGVLAGLGCLYWFHPFVRAAIARVRHSQEALRDWEALSTERAPAPTLYAETVLKLLEKRTEAREPALAVGFQTGSHETRKRILMIANFDKSSRGAWSLGAGLFLVLGWVSFTSAAPKAPLALQQSPPPPVPGPEIEVERHQPPPAWWATLDAALDQSLTVSLEDTDLHTVVDFLRESTGVNFVLQRSVFDDYGGDEYSFSYEVPDGTVRGFLNVMCRTIEDGVAYCYARDAVCIGYAGDLPWRQDLRFYRIAPLLEEGGEPDVLFDLVMTFTDPEQKGVWEREGAQMTYWNELFTVKQTDEVHARVHRFLNDLLRRSTKGDTGVGDGGDWAAKTRQMLADARLSIDFEHAEMGEALEGLSKILGIPVVLADEDLIEEPVYLTLVDARAIDVLGWIAAEYGMNVVPRDGVVELTYDAELVLEIYELGELDELAYDSEDLRNNLESMIYDDISPGIWESQSGAAIAYWEDLMLVNATPGMHVEIGQLLEAVVRAMR